MLHSVRPIDGCHMLVSLKIRGNWSPRMDRSERSLRSNCTDLVHSSSNPHPVGMDETRSICGRLVFLSMALSFGKASKKSATARVAVQQKSKPPTHVQSPYNGSAMSFPTYPFWVTNLPQSSTVTWQPSIGEDSYWQGLRIERYYSYKIIQCT